MGDAQAVADVLAGARGVLDKYGWHQGPGGIGFDGSVCAVVAIGIAGRNQQRVVDQAKRLVCEVTGAHFVHVWNDAPTTSREDLMLGLKRAEELALTEASS